ncbi:MAG: hypothetical protein ACRDWE_03120 [Acidimicrobiales bacterium]
MSSAPDSPERAALEAKLQDFNGRYQHLSWNGPFSSNPEETQALAQVLGTVARQTSWEIWMEKPGVPHSWTGQVGAPLRAAVQFDEDDLAASSLEYLAFRLTAAIAGMEAHEALELARFDGVYAVNPHGSGKQLGLLGALVTEYLTNAAVLS